MQSQAHTDAPKPQERDSVAAFTPPRVRHIFFTNIPLPRAVSSRLDRLDEGLQNTRQHALEATPAAIVNNSTNIIGAMDIFAEMLVFKATGSNLISPKNVGKPLHYIIDPPINLYRSVATRASTDITLKDLVNPDFYRKWVAEFADLEKAGAKDLKRGRLINRWQARAMLFSLAGMTVSAIIPQQKDDPNQTLEMGQLWRDAPMRYVGARFKQALWPLGWGEHKAQFAGLAKTITGVFSFLSSYRNVAEGKRYFRNPAHGGTAMITTAGGLQLMMGIDKEQSWQNYGATSWLRLALIPFSIHKRFFERDQRAMWYAASVGVFQLENTFAYLIGGAEKDANGHIVDKKTLRDQATKRVPALFEAAPQTEVESASIQSEQQVKQLELSL